MYRLLLSVILVLGLLGCSSVGKSTSEEKELSVTEQTIEEKAPDFALEDLAGKEVKLSDYKGKTVLLVFNTTWCPYCREEIPYLKELYAKYKEEGFEILNIDIQENRDKVAAFRDKYKLPYKVLLDKDGKVAFAYKVRGVPVNILIDKDGTILSRDLRLVEEILGELSGSNN